MEADKCSAGLRQLFAASLVAKFWKILSLKRPALCFSMLFPFGLGLSMGSNWISSIYLTSTTHALAVYFQGVASILRDKLIKQGLPDWRPLFEAFIILLLVFMPVLNSWATILPLLMLLWLGGDGRVHPLAKELAVFWIAMMVSAVFSGGLKAGSRDFTNYSSWLLIAYWSGKTFSGHFPKKILYFLVYSCLLWLGIGWMQQWAGVPTPPGWLEPEQRGFITVRSYSVFGNPNIFALYILMMMVFTCYLISDSLRLASKNLWIHKLLLIFILICNLISLYSTYSRFAWLLGILFLLCWFWPISGKWFQPVILLIPFLLLMLPGFKIRLAGLVTLTDSSLGYRIRIWQAVSKAIADFWLWGSGPGSFTTIYPWYQIQNTISAHAHQLFLQLWLENGIFSLVVFLWLAWSMVKGCFTDYGMAKTLALTLLIFLGYGLVETWSQNHVLGGYFWFFCGLWISLKDGEFITE